MHFTLTTFWRYKSDVVKFTYLFLLKNFFLSLFIFERERQNTSRGRAEREGDTESKPGSRLWVVSTEPDAGLETTNYEIMT